MDETCDNHLQGYSGVANKPRSHEGLRGLFAIRIPQGVTPPLLCPVQDLFVPSLHWRRWAGKQLLPYMAETIAHLLHKQFRLLPGWEMPACTKLLVVHQRGVALLHPAAAG